MPGFAAAARNKASRSLPIRAAPLSKLPPLLLYEPSTLRRCGFLKGQGGMAQNELRPGERALPFDPSETARDASLQFIGVIRSPWPDSSACPKNLRAARELHRPASVEIAAAFRPGLPGLERYSHVILLYWLDRARRDLMVQKPRSAEEPVATFAIRSPVRPNPIGLAVVRLLGCDPEAGRLEIDAIDCIDGTPLLDIKPYLSGIDAFPDASAPGRYSAGPET